MRKVLYDRKRLRKMMDEVRSIDVLMNTGPNAAIAPDDVRVPGGGPRWLVGEGDGELDPSVAEAADRCRRLAKLLRTTRQELKDVEFDHDDKRELRNALEQQAKAWTARADAWSAPTAPDVGTAVKEISRHDKESISSYAKVDRYLDRNAFAGIG